MHLQWKQAGAMGTNAIVGGGVPQAAGFAWANRQAGTGRRRDLLRGRRGQHRLDPRDVQPRRGLALPICFFIENNLYAVSTHVSEATGEPRLSGRGPGFGIRSWKVDGMDPLAVHLAMQEALATCGRATDLRSSRPTPTATSTRTALPGQCLRLPRPRRRRRTGASATRSRRSPRTSLRRGILTQEQVDACSARRDSSCRVSGGAARAAAREARRASAASSRRSGRTPRFVDVGDPGRPQSELDGIEFTDVDDHAGRLRTRSSSTPWPE
jgi:2-oxoisovalerate dehydrogenase E1 component